MNWKEFFKKQPFVLIIILSLIFGVVAFFIDKLTYVCKGGFCRGPPSFFDFYVYVIGFLFYATILFLLYKLVRFIINKIKK